LSEAPEVIIRKQGRAGRITLNRPHALNAVTHAMALAIEHALLIWRDDPHVALVVVDAAGEKAFCAGGDIQDLYRSGMAGDFEHGRRFWSDEYRLNALIAHYPKPYVALMDGITLGGGVGIGAHGSHRIVTERTMLAMPECGIGLVPDVGGSFILGHAPGRMGLYLGITGMRLKADGAIYTGFADHLVPHERMSDMAAALCESGDASAIADYRADPDAGNLRSIAHEVDEAFEGTDPVVHLQRLDAASADGNWQQDAAKAIRRASPLSVQCTTRIIAAAAGFSDVRDALRQEYRFVWRCMEQGDFLEGVRAQLIDKDRNPQWRHASLEEAASDAAAMLAPLGDEELVI
jgi:enoyl-CoA hydratase